MKLTKRLEQTIVFEDENLSATVRIEHHDRGERKWSASVHVIAFADTEPGVVDAIGLRLVQIANELTRQLCPECVRVGNARCIHNAHITMKFGGAND